MKPETQLYKTLKQKLNRYPIELKRIENDIELGTPDLYYYTIYTEGWIELKQIKSLPKQASTKIKIPFRPGQYAWLLDRVRLNPMLHSFLVVKIEERLYVFYNSQIQEAYTLGELLAKNCFNQSLVGLVPKDLFECIALVKNKNM